MITTPTITAAIARLCIVLRALGFHRWAVAIERTPDVLDWLRGVKLACEHEAAARMFLDEPARDDALAMRLGTTALAAWWLSSAVHALVGPALAMDEELADQRANEAMALLAWPETTEIVTQARVIMTGERTTLEVLRLLPSLDAVVRAYGEAVGAPLLPLLPHEVESAKPAGGEGPSPTLRADDVAESAAQLAGPEIKALRCWYAAAPPPKRSPVGRPRRNVRQALADRGMVDSADALAKVTDLGVAVLAHIVDALAEEVERLLEELDRSRRVAYLNSIHVDRTITITHLRAAVTAIVGATPPPGGHTGLVPIAWPGWPPATAGDQTDALTAALAARLRMSEDASTEQNGATP